MASERHSLDVAAGLLVHHLKACAKLRLSLGIVFTKEGKDTEVVVETNLVKKSYSRPE